MQRECSSLPVVTPVKLSCHGFKRIHKTPQEMTTDYSQTIILEWPFSFSKSLIHFQ